MYNKEKYLPPYSPIKNDNFYSQVLPSAESATTVCGVNYQVLAVMLLKYPKGQPPVAKNHSQLLTTACETVDPTD